MKLPHSLWTATRLRALLPASLAILIFAAACTGDSPDTTSSTPTVPPGSPAASPTATPAVLPPLSVGDGLFTWSPQWQTGDSRQISVAALVGEIEFDTEGMTEEAQNALPNVRTALQGFARAMALLRAGESRFIITETGPDGTVGELKLSTLIPPGDFQGISGTQDAAGFLDTLEPVEITAHLQTDRYGAVTEIVNLEEVAGRFVQLASDLEQKQTGEAPPPEDVDTFMRLMQTESGAQSIQALVEAKAGHLFLLRPGEYRVGETVEATVDMPTSVGQMVPANAKYVLTEITDGTAHFDVTLEPSAEGLFHAYRQMAEETAAVTGQEMQPFPELDSEQAQQGLELFKRLLPPYTVKLKVDTATGWISGAEWTETFPLSQNPPAQVAIGFTTSVT